MIKIFKQTEILTVVSILVLFALPTLVATAYTQPGVSSSSSNFLGSNSVPMKNPDFAGYITLPNATNNYEVSAVYGFFIQPTITCDSSAPYRQGVAFTVTLLNQSGPVAYSTTFALCKTGATTPHYFGILGNTFANIPIQPGDAYAAAVSYSSGVFYMSLTNLTTNQSSYAQESLGNPGSLSGGLVVLHPGPRLFAQFSTVSFAGYVTINGTTMGLGAFPPSTASLLEGILTNAKGNIVEAVPSHLSHDGTDFTLTWKHA